MIYPKHKVVIFLILVSTSELSAGIREDFHKKDPDRAQLQLIIENTYYDKNVLSEAYKGLCQTMMAQHVFWPSSKISYFNKGKKIIDEAIAAAPDNYELRYIRLLVQLNAPAFLGYNKEII